MSASAKNKVRCSRKDETYAKNPSKTMNTVGKPRAQTLSNLQAIFEPKEAMSNEEEDMDIQKSDHSNQNWESPNKGK